MALAVALLVEHEHICNMRNCGQILKGLAKVLFAPQPSLCVSQNYELQKRHVDARTIL